MKSDKQVAIVTGASSGMGLGITRALLEHGWRVVGTARTISESKDLKSSADLVLVDGDIGAPETAVKVADAAVTHFGRIDLLVNCAGIYTSKPFTEYTPEDFEKMIHTNVAGYFFVTQQAVKQMRKLMATTEPFAEHAQVADGASNLFVQIFGPEAGHVRLVYGVQSLPVGAPVIVDTIFEIEPLR